MDYKIVEKQAFRVLEKVELHSTVNSQNTETIPAFWDRSRADGTLDLLAQKATDKTWLFGICYGNIPEDGTTFPYSIAVLYDGDEPAPEGFRISEIPAATWAVFSCVGAMPDAIQNAWQKISGEFLPTSGYRNALNNTRCVDIEAYTQGDMSAPDYRSEIWLPVSLTVDPFDLESDTNPLQRSIRQL